MATVVAIDARANELVRLDAQDRRLAGGGFRWASPRGTRRWSLGNQLAQVLPSGKLLLVGLESGELESTVNLGRPLAPLAGARRGRPAPLLAGPAGLPVRARARAACRALRSSISDMPMRPFPVPGTTGPVPDRPGKRLALQQPVARPASRTGRGEGEAGAGRGRFRVDLADARERRARSSGGSATKGDTRRSAWATTRTRRRFARWRS